MRSEPLVVAEGRLERFASAGGAINVVVDRSRALDAPGRLVAEVKELGKNLAIVGAEPRRRRRRSPPRAAGGDFRAVAPPVMSFTQGAQAVSL